MIGDRDRLIFPWSGSALILICVIVIGIVIGKNSEDRDPHPIISWSVNTLVGRPQQQVTFWRSTVETYIQKEGIIVAVVEDV